MFRGNEVATILVEATLVSVFSRPAAAAAHCFPYTRVASFQDGFRRPTNEAGVQASEVRRRRSRRRKRRGRRRTRRIFSRRRPRLFFIPRRLAGWRHLEEQARVFRVPRYRTFLTGLPSHQGRRPGRRKGQEDVLQLRRRGPRRARMQSAKLKLQIRGVLYVRRDRSFSAGLSY